MLEFLDIRFNFLCRTTYKNKDGKNPIILRVVFRGQRRDVFTGIYCNGKEWDALNGCILKSKNDALVINPNLENIKRKANNVFDQMRFNGEQFSIDELVDKIKGKEERPALLIDFLEEGNKKMLKRVGIEITKATYYKYRKSLEYMQEFLLNHYKVKNYLLLRIDTKFIESYFYFLRTEKNISHNTSLKYLSFLKVILSPAIRSGIIKDDPYAGLRFRAKPVYRNFLTQEEITKLENLQLENEDMIRKRDIFLFACYTGLAYIDIKQLRRDHIICDADKSYYILKPRQKTGQESIIPLLPTAEKLLRKYSITGDLLDFDWYISSNQKMNFGLKIIGKKAEITKILHMHMARHTFVTTVTLANGVPIETVSRMLGHANIRQTQHYAKVVAAKIKLDMAKIKEIYK
jgi:site-specific recombinase XerD